jgi:hypothetical protein
MTDVIVSEELNACSSAIFQYLSFRASVRSGFGDPRSWDRADASRETLRFLRFPHKHHSIPNYPAQKEKAQLALSFSHLRSGTDVPSTELSNCIPMLIRNSYTCNNSRFLS